MDWTGTRKADVCLTIGDRLYLMLGAWSVALLLLATPATGAAEEAVGLLPASGDAALIRRIDSDLAPALARKVGVRLLDPVEVRSMLGRAPGVVVAVDSARSWVVQAEQNLLHMKRQEAIDASREAIAALEAVGGRYHKPRLLSRANVALARALLLRPADPAGARQALQSALDVSPDLLVDQLPPKAARLARQVKETRTPASPPSDKELTSISQQGQVSTLVWISARQVTGEIQVELLIHSQGAQVLSQRQRAMVSPDTLLEELTGMTASALTKTSVSLSRPPPAAPVQATPWYHRWWVWTLAGAVVIGTTVGVVVATRSEDHESYRFTFRF